MRMLGLVLWLCAQGVAAQSGLQWQAESTVATGSGVFIAFNNTAALARDAQGRTLVVWADTSGPKFARQTSASVWTSVDLPKLNPAASASKPSLAMAGAQALVVWSELSSGTTRVVTSRSLDGGSSWQAPIELAAGKIESPVALYAFGRDDGSVGAVVAWFSSEANTVFSRAWRGSSWSAADWSDAAALTASGGQGHDVTLGGRLDIVWAAWEDARAGAKELWLNRSTDGGLTWEQDRRLPRQDGGSARGEDPSLALEVNGTVHLAYQLTGKVYLSSSLDAGVSFGAPRLLGNGLFAHASANGYSGLAFSWEDFTGNLFDDSIKRVGLAVSLDHLANLGGPYTMPGSEQVFGVVQGAVASSADGLDVLWIDVGSTPGQRVLKHRAARIESAQFAAAVSGSAARQSMAALWRIAEADLGQAGSRYLAALAGVNWWLHDGSTWHPWTGGALASVATGNLNHAQLKLFDNTDVTALRGVQLFGAYQRDGGPLVYQPIWVFP